MWGGAVSRRLEQMPGYERSASHAARPAPRASTRSAIRVSTTICAPDARPLKPPRVRHQLLGGALDGASGESLDEAPKGAEG